MNVIHPNVACISVHVLYEHQDIRAGGETRAQVPALPRLHMQMIKGRSMLQPTQVGVGSG